MKHILVWVVILLISVMLHEFGHMFAARAVGVKVDAYSIGFGPSIFSYKGRETEWCIHLLPFGGSCAIDDESFEKASPAKQIFIFLAGPMVNIVLMLIFLSVVLLAKDSFGFQQMSEAILRSVQAFFGMIVDATVNAAVSTDPVVIENFKEAGEMLRNSPTMADYAVMICNLVYSANLLLAVSNLLPIPGLDGGQIALTLPALAGHPLNERLTNVLNAVCATSIMGFMTFVAIKDIVFFII